MDVQLESRVYFVTCLRCHDQSTSLSTADGIHVGLSTCKATDIALRSIICAHSPFPARSSLYRATSHSPINWRVEHHKSAAMETVQYLVSSSYNPSRLLLTNVVSKVTSITRNLPGFIKEPLTGLIGKVGVCPCCSSLWN